MVLQRSPKACSSHNAQASAPVLDVELNEDTLCGLAKMVPKLPKTGVASRDALLPMKRRGLQAIIQHLWTHDDEIFNCLASLQCGSCSSAAASASSETWDKSVVNVMRLPKYYVAQVLEKGDRSASPLTQEVLDRIDTADSEAIRKIFRLHARVQNKTKITQDMKLKDICSKAIALRFKECGHTLTGWAAISVDPYTGRIDWGAGSPYQITWAPDGFASTVTFWGANPQSAAELRITQDFDFDEMWDVWRAMARKGIQKYTLHELWQADGTGPYLLAPGGLDTKGAELQTASERSRVQAVSMCHNLAQNTVQDDPEFIGDTTKDAKRDRAKKMRQACSERKEANRSVKLVKLTTGEDEGRSPLC